MSTMNAKAASDIDVEATETMLSCMSLLQPTNTYVAYANNEFGTPPPTPRYKTQKRLHGEIEDGQFVVGGGLKRVKAFNCFLPIPVGNNMPDLSLPECIVSEKKKGERRVWFGKEIEHQLNEPQCKGT